MGTFHVLLGRRKLVICKELYLAHLLGQVEPVRWRGAFCEVVKADLSSADVLKLVTTEPAGEYRDAERSQLGVGYLYICDGVHPYGVLGAEGALSAGRLVHLLVTHQTHV